MINKLLRILIALSMLAGLSFIWALGYLVIKYPDVPITYSCLQYFAGLAIIMLIQQGSLLIVILYDYTHRIWHNNIMLELWKKLFSYNCLNYALSLIMIAYFFVVISKTQNNIIDKTAKNKVVMGILSKVCAVYIQLFVFLFALTWIAMSLKSINISLFLLKLMALYLIIIFPLAILFQQIIIFHFTSREWTDCAFEKYFTKRTIFLPGISIAEYYNDVVKKEIS